MNTGQSLLAIGAFILLSIMVLRTNNTFLSTDTVVQETKFGVLATSLASSYIEEASKTKFDEVDDAAISDSSSLSDHLGLDGGETRSMPPDDFDDYNGLDTTITNLPSATFNLKCAVCYINPENPEVAVSNKTWNKKITVTVTSPFSRDTIKISSIYSYFRF
jgi:hypothetical protein